MARKSLRKVRLNECPSCGEELMDMGYDREGKYYEKQCPACDKIFRRIKGYGHYWYEVDIMEI